jgi:PRTRC genetic system ThiF family protein
MELDLSFANACRLKLPEYTDIRLILVGCGGTGSWLAPAVARAARLMIDLGKTVQVLLVDPDKVEEKNVYRQNFARAEIGRWKASTLALRYGTAWGVPISASPIKLNYNSLLVFLNRANYYTAKIFIGCVDNAGAREDIDRIANGLSSAWWLDCGNTKNSGQVLLGKAESVQENAFVLPGFCSWLPSPVKQEPSLLEDAGEETETGENLSCAEMALMNAQGLAINQRMAAEAADYLMRMLITQDLRKMATYIDLESGASKSRYITEENVMKEAQE